MAGVPLNEQLVEGLGYAPWWYRQVHAMSGQRHLFWEQCSHGLTSRPLEKCHHQCARAVCGVSGAFGWLLEAPLLHHSFFQSVSPHGENLE